MKIGNIKSDIEQKPNARINWTKIAGTAANGAKNLFEPIMPATMNTISSTSSVMSDIRNAMRATRAVSQKQANAQKNSIDNKRSMNLFKSAFNDISSGNFSMDNINNDLYDDYESGTSNSFEMPKGDDAVDMSTEEILLLGNKGVAQSVIQSTSAQLRGLEASSKALIKSNIKSTQALGLSINNTLNHGFSAINTTLQIQNQKLDSISRGIHGILEFNNKNAIEFYTKSIDMMSGIGKMMENYEKMMYPSSRKKERKFDTSNGFNFREYAEYVKEGFKESLVGSASGAIKGSGSSIKDYGIMGILTDMLIPKTLKEPLEKFDKSLTKFFDEGFKRLGEKLNSDSWLSMLGLGDIFGSKRSKIKSLNLSQYMKDATPWNGVAQKALVEVIPELLTSIDSKLDGSEKRYYDYEKGQFKSKSKIEEDFRNEYLDTFSLMLRESMDKLTEAAQSTGRHSGDQERLITSIQALIDDQISGRKDTMAARLEMDRQMRDFGIGKDYTKNFIMEFQSSLEGAIDRINDLYHEIGTTQHVYRNINNSHGSEYTRTLNKMHSRDSKDRVDYRRFSFTGGSDYVSHIQRLQKKAGISGDYTSDKAYVAQILSMLGDKSIDEDSIIRYIREYGGVNDVKSHVSNSKFAFIRKTKELYGKAKTGADKVGRKIGGFTNTIENAIYDPIYLGKMKGGGKLDKKEEKARAQLDDINNKDYDKMINQSTAENDKDQRNMSLAINAFKKSPDATTLEDSVIRSNNILFAGISAMLAGFKGFTSRLFGKEGFFRKFWDSETRKKATDKLKEKLFTGDNAIFKKQYDGAKAGLKKFWDRTKGHLADGYDYVYDSTMQYMYGDKYQENEKWKNNKFVSETLNRKWRAEQKKAKDKVGNTVNENSKNALIGLPEKSSFLDPTERERLMKRQSELKGILSAGRMGDSSYSTDEVQKATEEWKDIKKRLQAPIEKTTNSLMVLGDKIEGNTKAFAEATVGDIDKPIDAKKKEYKDSFFKKMKATMPKALAGAIAGAGVGLLNNQFSLLGSMFLPGGPISGAIVGGGLTILSQTEAFKTFMFGKMNPETQKREGGMINDKMRGAFKKMLPFAVGGAVVGGLKALVKGSLGFNGGLGVLGMQILPGGIIGGAMLGAGLGILKNSEGFKKMLFGEKGEDGKRSGKFLSDSFNKLKGGFSKLLPGIKKAGVGLGLGALTGAVLSNAGYIPAMFSLGGPIGMGVAGLGLGIAASSKRFNEWMFGSEELDENGNPTGKRRKDGMLTRVQNILMVNVVEPISDAFKTKMLDLVDWTKDKITYPFRLAFGPILDSLIGIKDNIVDFAKDKFEAIGNGIMDVFRKTTKTLFSPITKAFGFIGKSIMGIASSATKLALAPVSIGLQGLQFLTAGKRRGEYAEFYKNYYSKGNISEALRDKWDAEAESGNRRNIFSKISDTIGAYMGHGEIADAAREGWNNQMAAEGKNHLNWRTVGQERRAMKDARRERHANEKQWRKIDKYRSKIINDDLGGREVTLTDYQFEKYRDKFKKLGISEDQLQSSDDIMDLLYRRNEFKKKLDPTGRSGGLVIQETPEQKAAREKTEAYQNSVKAILDRMAERMGIAAKEINDKKNLQSAKEEWTADKKKLAKRLKRARIKNIDIDNPELQDFDINEVDDDRLKDYRFSKYYQTGDFLGFLKGFKITQKSKYNSNISGSNIGGASIDTPSKAEEILKEMNDNIKDLKNISEDQKDISSAQLEVATSGEIDDDTVKKKKGKSFGSRIMNKFSAVASFLGFKKKKEKSDAEDAESKAAREGTDELDLDDNESKSEKDESGNAFTKFFNKIKSGAKSLLGIIGGSAIGSFLLKGVKTLGVVGLVSGLGLGILEMIKPGTHDKILNKTKELTDAIEKGDFYEEYIKPKMNTVLEFIGNGIQKGTTWFGENFPTIFENYVLPSITKTAEFVAKNATVIGDLLGTIIEGIVPPLADAFCKVAPTILGSFFKAIYNATIGDWTGHKIGGDKETSFISDSSIPDARDKEALAKSVNSTGKGSYVDSTTGEVVNVSAKSITVNEDGSLTIEYNEDNTMNRGLVSATTSGFIKGSANAARSGIHGAAGRAAAKLPFKVIGGVGGAATGATLGTSAGALGGPVGMFTGAVTGGYKGAKKGVKAGGKVGEKVTEKSSNFFRTYLKDATTEHVSESRRWFAPWKKGISSSVDVSDISISKEGLEKSIQEATEKALANASSGGGALAVKLATEQAQSNVLSDAVSAAVTQTLESNNQTATKESIEKATKNITAKLIKETDSGTVSEVVEKLSTNTAKEAAENAAEGAVKAAGKAGSKAIKETRTSVVTKLFNMIKDGIDKLVKNEKVQKIIGKFTADSGILGKFIKGFKEIIEKLAKKIFSNENLLMKLAAKASTGLAELGLRTTPLAIAFAALDLVNGAWSAENLFMVPKGEADWLMRLISALFELVLGISPIYLVNIVLEVAQAIMDTNWKSDWACALYKLMAPKDGGFGLIGDTALDDQRIALQIATDKYNADHGTNISVQEYNDKINKGLGGTIWDGVKAIGNAFGGNFETQWNASYKVSDEEIAAYKKKHGLGNGPSKPVIVNGMYAQGDPRWGKMPIGMLPDGTVATMDRAGCGPTALAAVANTVAERNVGYGPLTPGDVGAYAASNGYISEGGANAGLFTEGAARMGLNSSPISNAGELRENLLAGKPTILTGKSNSSSDPYTQAGHIVMADGMYGDAISVVDPINGKRKLYNINDVSANTEHAWAYSAGYGPRPSERNDDYKPRSTGYVYKNPDSRKAIANAKRENASTKTTTKSNNMSTSEFNNLASKGLTDSATTLGYHTGDSGLDDQIMVANYNYFISNDEYYTKKWLKILGHTTVLDTRTSRGTERLSFEYILTTQYFGTSGGSYGSISITKQPIYSADYSGSGNGYNTDFASKIFAAAVMSEHKKGNMFITSPLSNAEKMAALCNAYRVMYGLDAAINGLYYGGFLRLITLTDDSSYTEILKENNVIGEEITQEISGITNADQLAEIAKQRKGFGKLKLLGYIMKAKVNSMMNGTDFWVEFEKLTREETSGSTSSSNLVVNGASTTLRNSINSPNNIQEELLGKTIEAIYRGESGGNYASVITDSNDKLSIGPYHANAGNAETLLSDLKTADGLSADLKKTFSTYESKLKNNNKISSDDITTLSNALGNEEYSDIIKAAIDKNAMKYVHNTFYKPHYADYYDTNIIKDLRTLPMLADIGNTGPALITDKTKSNSFMKYWVPVTKDKDFESAYKLLNDARVYWASTAAGIYRNGYLNRIKATYDTLKNYTFKKPVEPGKLGEYFAKNTNPLGFGNLDQIAEVGEVAASTVTNNEKVQKFSNALSELGDIMITRLSNMTGMDASDLGLSSLSSDGSTTTYSNPSYNGSYTTNNQGSLTSLTGTDRDRMIAAARSQIGYMEKADGSDLRSFTWTGNGNYSKYGKEMGSNPNPWCAYFTSWAAKAAGIPTDIVPRSGACTTIYDTARSKGIMKYRGEYTPQQGDIVLFNNGWNAISNPRNATVSSHIGIVTGINGDDVYTIEGNTCPTSDGRQGVYERTRKLSANTIIGFVHPNWTNEVKTVNPSSELSLGYGKGSKSSSSYYNPDPRKTIAKSGNVQKSTSTSVPSNSATSNSIDYENITGNNRTELPVTGSELQRIMTIVNSQIGYSEKNDASDLKAFTWTGNGNYTKYAKEIGIAPNAWCAYFTSWAAKAAGIPKSTIYQGSDGSCDSIYNTAKRNGTMKYRGEYTPVFGDLILFNDGWKPIEDPKKAVGSDHTGFVTKTDGDTVYTIEGNSRRYQKAGSPEGVYPHQYKLSDNRLIGFVHPNYSSEVKTITPSSLLSLGYGNPSTKFTKIDSPAYREQMRKAMDNTRDFAITAKDFEAIGFGPGMTVDAGFDMSNTDSKLEQIFGVIAEWYAESKKTGAASSSATHNTNIVDARTTNIASVPTNNHKEYGDVNKYKEKLVNHHLLISAKQNVRDHM